MFQPAFGCAHYPKAGRNTQQIVNLVYLYLRQVTGIKPTISIMFLTFFRLKIKQCTLKQFRC